MFLFRWMNESRSRIRRRIAIFVSIHFNDSRQRGVHGFETYYHSPYASELANRIQAKLMTIPNSANRGVHTANFRVLRLAAYPAVLVECGFLSNRREGGEARDVEYRELLADRIAEAIVEQRYGPGVYHTSAEATVEPRPPSEGPGGLGSSAGHSSSRLELFCGGSSELSGSNSRCRGSRILRKSVWQPSAAPPAGVCRLDFV